LARLHRAGELTAVRVPSPAEEAVRDLVRARGDLLDDRKRMQQRLNAMLLRHGRIWRGATWTYAHRMWAGKQAFAEPALAEALASYRGGLEARRPSCGRPRPGWLTGRAAIRWLARSPGWAATRGIAQLTGLTLAAEVVDWRRFASARAFMGFAGLIPTEYSSGSRTRRGHITKAGPEGVRTALIERRGPTVPAGDRRHAAPAAGRPRAGDAGPLVEGAAAAARHLPQAHRSRQACWGRRGGGRPRAGRVRVGRDDQLNPSPEAGGAPGRTPRQE